MSEQIIRFPDGSHDDQVDALSLAARTIARTKIMTESEWLTSAHPSAMLDLLMVAPCSYPSRVRPSPRVSARTLRLFAAACYRDVAHEADIVYCGGTEAAEEAERWAESGEYRGRHFGRHAAPSAPEYARQATQWAEYHRGKRTRPDIQRTQAGFLRDIMGNPFAPVDVTCYWKWFGPGEPPWSMKEPGVSQFKDCGSLRPDWAVNAAPWLEAIRLARHLYDSRDYSQMPYLADAVEESGCNVGRVQPAGYSPDGKVYWISSLDSNRLFGSPEDAGEHPLLRHLRGPGPHVLGCWALDLILSKE